MSIFFKSGVLYGRDSHQLFLFVPQISQGTSSPSQGPGVMVTDGLLIPVICAMACAESQRERLTATYLGVIVFCFSMFSAYFLCPMA